MVLTFKSISGPFETHDPASNCSKTMAAMVRKSFKRGVRKCFFRCATICVLLRFKSISGAIWVNFGAILGSFWGRGYPRDPLRTPGAPGADFGPIWGACWVPSGLLWDPFWVPFRLLGAPGRPERPKKASQNERRGPEGFKVGF